MYRSESPHKEYLGREFSKAFEEVECAYVGGAGHVHVSLLALVSVGVTRLLL